MKLRRFLGLSTPLSSNLAMKSVHDLKIFVDHTLNDFSADQEKIYLVSDAGT